VSIYPKFCLKISGLIVITIYIYMRYVGVNIFYNL